MRSRVDILLVVIAYGTFYATGDVGKGDRAEDPVGAWKLKCVSPDGKPRECIVTVFRDGVDLKGSYTAEGVTQPAKYVGFDEGILSVDIDGKVRRPGLDGLMYKGSATGRHPQGLQCAVVWLGLLRSHCFRRRAYRATGRLGPMTIDVSKGGSQRVRKPAPPVSRRHACDALSRGRVAFAAARGIAGLRDRQDGWAAQREVGQGGVGLDAAGLGQVDPLVGEVDLELAVARQLQREADRERAPLARLALQVDVAAEELGQLADDRQAQARSPGARGSGRRRPGRGALAWRNFSKIVSRSSSAIPMPVSSTSMTTNRPSARARRVTRPPSGVNLIAFESRL